MITQKIEAAAARALVYAGTLFTVIILLGVVGYILIKGIPNLSLNLFAWEYNTENVSLMPALINTILMTLLSLVFAAPLGICAAIYLAEYAKKGNKMVKLVRITAETLAGIPSII
ncbi:MAG: phosphate ABC transporter, permease protein PstA, partial [Desulfotomaculaceae bacterium]|nr:phosphate ABC transporter, permease protein PstA [Desulfotomaculaceae bacterium]